MATRKVTVIPPTINPLTRISNTTVKKRRTAGNARVSTDKDEQSLHMRHRLTIIQALLKTTAVGNL